MVSEKVCGWLPPNPNKNVWEEQLKCEWTDWLRNQMWDIPYYENKKSLRTLFLASTPAETADWTPIPRQSYFSPWEPQSYLVPVPVPPKWVGLNITPKSYGLSSCFPLKLPYFLRRSAFLDPSSIVPSSFHHCHRVDSNALTRLEGSTKGWVGGFFSRKQCDWTNNSRDTMGYIANHTIESENWMPQAIESFGRWAMMLTHIEMKENDFWWVCFRANPFRI